MVDNTDFDRILTEFGLDKEKFQPLSFYFVNITLDDMKCFSEYDLENVPRAEHMLLMHLFILRFNEYKKQISRTQVSTTSPGTSCSQPKSTQAHSL